MGGMGLKEGLEARRRRDSNNYDRGVGFFYGGFPSRDVIGRLAWERDDQVWRRGVSRGRILVRAPPSSLGDPFAAARLTIARNCQCLPPCGLGLGSSEIFMEGLEPHTQRHA